MKIRKDWLKFTLTSLKKLLSFAVTVRDISASSNGKPLTESNLSNLYYRCSDTPLQVFIDVLCFQRYERLIKTGSAKKEDLQAAWFELFAEYCDLSGSNEMNEVLQVTKKIGSLRSKLTAINLAVFVLSNIESEGSKETLKKLGFAYEFGENLVQDLHNVLATVKSYEMELKSLQKKYEQLTSKNKQDTIKEAYFSKILVELSKYMGFQIKATTSTVEEFLMIKNSYERDLKARAANGK